MRSLVVATWLTLDGVMQSPGAPDEDPTGGFVSGGWMVPYWDEAVSEVMDQYIGKDRPFELLIGRRTYELMAAYWPNAGPEETPEAMNDAPKHVASRTLDRVDWQNSSLIKGDVVEYVSALKTRSGPEIQVHGSSELVQTLLGNGLVDEFRLWIFPVLVGGGKRLFAGGTLPSGLRLIDTRTAGSGAVFTRYEVAGPLSTGALPS